jgi:hypothetical protein
VDHVGVTYAELNIGREEGELLAELLGESGRASSISINRDIGRSDNALLALHGTDDLEGEFCASVSHGEGGRSSTVLGLDDFITTKLDAVDKSVKALLCEA